MSDNRHERIIIAWCPCIKWNTYFPFDIVLEDGCVTLASTASNESSQTTHLKHLSCCGNSIFTHLQNALFDSFAIRYLERWRGMVCIDEEFTKLWIIHHVKWLICGYIHLAWKSSKRSWSQAPAAVSNCFLKVACIVVVVVSYLSRKSDIAARPSTFCPTQLRSPPE